MGDWYLEPDPMRPGQTHWRYDPDASRPDPSVTAMLPAVPREDEPEDDGHVDPAEFLSFDGIDSQMIRSIGAPE